MDCVSVWTVCPSCVGCVLRDRLPLRALCGQDKGGSVGAADPMPHTLPCVHSPTFDYSSAQATIRDACNQDGLPVSELCIFGSGWPVPALVIELVRQTPPSGLGTLDCFRA